MHVYVMQSTFMMFLSHWVLGGVVQLGLKIAVACVSLLTTHCTLLLVYSRIYDYSMC